jgi:DnaJ-class molecular chaperone
MSPFVILGITSNASISVARRAYRKLAMQHHPDRGGSESKFKEVKAAWEKIEKGYQDEPNVDTSRRHNQWRAPEPPGNTWWSNSDSFGDVFEEMKRANRSAPNFREFHKEPDEYVANVTLREAFNGFNIAIPRRLNGMVQTASINIPPGTPNGYRGKYNCSIDNSTVIIITRIDTQQFSLRSFDDANNLFTAGMNIGDIEIDREIDAIDLITGTWITVSDFLSEKLTVRVPAGFNPLCRLKIAGKGYYGWNTVTSSVSARRQDMYLKLLPVFNKPADIERQKIIDLYNSVQGTE